MTPVVELPIADEGILDGASTRRASLAHRREIKKSHKLGFQKSKSPCLSCGHRICRCADNKARAELFPGK